jgi:hypothetical protein
VLDTAHFVVGVRRTSLWVATWTAKPKTGNVEDNEKDNKKACMQNLTKRSDLSASEYRTVGIMGVASSLLALVAIVALVSRRREASPLHNIVQEAATTPASDTAADAL